MPTLVVRRLEPPDWRLYRELRLAALADAPYAFGSTLAVEQPFDDRQWQDRLTHRVTMIAEADGRAVGLVGVVAGDDDEGTDTVELVSMWVDPTARGTGVGDALVAAVLRWVDEHGPRPVGLWVSDGNRPAERLYARHGFLRTGRVQPVRDDGEELEFAMRRPAPEPGQRAQASG